MGNSCCPASGDAVTSSGDNNNNRRRRDYSPAVATTTTGGAHIMADEFPTDEASSNIPEVAAGPSVVAPELAAAEAPVATATATDSQQASDAPPFVDALSNNMIPVHVETIIVGATAGDEDPIAAAAAAAAAVTTPFVAAEEHDLESPLILIQVPDSSASLLHSPSANSDSGDLTGPHALHLSTTSSSSESKSSSSKKKSSSSTDQQQTLSSSADLDSRTAPTIQLHQRSPSSSSARLGSNDNNSNSSGDGQSGSTMLGDSAHLMSASMSDIRSKASNNNNNNNSSSQMLKDSMSGSLGSAGRENPASTTPASSINSSDNSFQSTASNSFGAINSCGADGAHHHHQPGGGVPRIHLPTNPGFRDTSFCDSSNAVSPLLSDADVRFSSASSADSDRLPTSDSSSSSFQKRARAGASFSSRGAGSRDDEDLRPRRHEKPARNNNMSDSTTTTLSSDSSSRSRTTIFDGSAGSLEVGADVQPAAAAATSSSSDKYTANGRSSSRESGGRRGTLDPRSVAQQQSRPRDMSTSDPLDPSPEVQWPEERTGNGRSKSRRM